MSLLLEDDVSFALEDDDDLLLEDGVDDEPAVPGATGPFLLEDGTSLFLEDGTALLFEASSVPAGSGVSPQWATRGLTRRVASRGFAR